VLKFRSVKSIVIAPAKTGRDRRRRIEVINTDQTNKGIESKDEKDLMFKIVVIKLIAPKMEEMPAKCKLKIAKSTEK
jgi:hypothetical protein